MEHVDRRELPSIDREEVPRPWIAAPPPPALVIPEHEDRPIEALRRVACDPVRALREAAASWRTDRMRAAALAEMAVTGRRARAEFDRLSIGGADLSSDGAGASALAHAHAVRRYLDAGPDTRRAMARTIAHAKHTWLDPRFDAPWLAVAAELDPPARPVNVGVTAHAQRDVEVRVGDVRLVARCAIAGALDAERGAVVLLHGLGSRLEEVDVVASELAARGLGIVSVDLPSQGYTTRVAPNDIGDPARGSYRVPSWDRDEGYAYLAFAERFIVALVEALGIRERVVALGGGSLGGTLALRAAIHGTFGPGVRSIAWSPGSVWGTQQTNYVNWAAIEATVGRRLFRGEVLAEDRDLDGHDSRTDYIRWIFESKVALVKPQPALWFKGMPRQDELTHAARADRRELYDHAHRVTCLALAYEQTIYSITETAHGDTRPRFARIGAPVMVMAGSRDDDILDIHREVGKLADRMRTHGRRGRIVRLDACHSIHGERPRTLAAEIDSFLRDAA
jgi:alpha-beta hydrolase superfamily lysophospholipase